MNSKTRAASLSRKIICALCCLVLACGMLPVGFAAHPAYAAEAGEVGSTFTVTHVERNEAGDVVGTGDLTFQVTAVATEDKPGEVTITDGKDYTGELVVNEVSQTVGGAELSYAVTALSANSFRNNSMITGVTFRSDLTGGAGWAVGGNNSSSPYGAFTNCDELAYVRFECSEVRGIGVRAFFGCEKLAEMSFREGSKITGGIGSGAFAGCTSLESITFPAITGAYRSGDMYHTTSEYRSGVNSSSTNQKAFFSGASSYWHGGSLPSENPAFGEDVFSRCSNLKTITFKAGNSTGMFAYFTPAGIIGSSSVLEAVIFEDDQAYFGNPNASAQNDTYKNFWEDAELPETFSLYYAVNYYASDSLGNVESDDARASSRMARVEYKRCAPVDALARGDAKALAEWEYADPSVYAEEGYADGETPDPNEAAKTLDSYDPSATYVWKLTDTQSRRRELSDSCSAYLVKQNDISAGRVDADEINAMYASCDYNLSQGVGFVEDSPFDTLRYVGLRTPPEGTSEQVNPDMYTVGQDASQRFVLGSSAESDLLNSISIVAPGGETLDTSDYDVSFQRLDESTGELVPATLGTQDGALLMTVTPKADSGYVGSLQEWVIVESHAGKVLNLCLEDSANTSKSAYYRDSVTDKDLIPFDAPYTVGISTKDPASALVAAGYAGLVGAPVAVSDTENAGYGFVAGSVSVVTGKPYGDAVAFTADPERFDSVAAFAASAFQAFENRRATLDAPAEKYPWGTTAVLVDPASIGSVAAATTTYSYAKAAPVFYLKDDGTVGDQTLQCLKQFENVAVMGDATLFPESAFSQLSEDLGQNSDGEGRAFRISSDAGSGCALSIEVARILSSEGDSRLQNVAICDAGDVADAVGALNFSGHMGGVTLTAACSADAKRISSYLRSERDEVSLVCLFGRGGTGDATGFDLTSSLSTLWDESGYTEPAIEAGDTLLVEGALFEVGDGGKLMWQSDVSPHGVIASGAHLYNGVEYALDSAVRPYETIADLSDAVIELPQSSYVYANGTVTPEPSVSVGGLKLESGTDYTVSYTSNDAVGTAWVIIEGTGSFKGEARTSFSIIEKQEEPPSDDPSQEDPGTKPDNDSIISWSVNPVVWDNPVTWLSPSPTPAPAPSAPADDPKPSVSPSSTPVTQPTVPASSQQPTTQLTLGTTPSSGSTSTGSTTGGSTATPSAQSGSTSRGALELDITDPFSDDEGQTVTPESETGITPVEAWDGTPTDEPTVTGSGNEPETTSSGVSPGVVGLFVAAAVAAVAAAIGFVMRRPKDAIDPIDLR